MDKIKIEQHGFTAFSWFAGWLFSIGFLHFPLGKAILAICLWPYYLGVAISQFIQK